MSSPYSNLEGSKGQENLENSSDQELYEINFRGNQKSQKQSSFSPKNNQEYNHDEVGDDGCINIYKSSNQEEYIDEEQYQEDFEEEQNEEQEHDYEEQQEEQFQQNQQDAYYQRQNHQEEEQSDDEDELDEINGKGNFEIQKIDYEAHNLNRQKTNSNSHQKVNQMNAQIEGHNNQISYGTQNRSNNKQNDLYATFQPSKQNNYIQESQDNQHTDNHQQNSTLKKQAKRSSELYNQNISQDSNYDEQVRFEKQLSKMTPEEAEIEYQNRYNQKLLQLHEKQQSLKRNGDSQTSSPTNTQTQTYKIQADSVNQQQRKGSEQQSQISQQSNKASQNSWRQQNSQVRSTNGIEQINTVKSSIVISSQDTFQNNSQKTQQSTNRMQSMNSYSQNPQNNITKNSQRNQTQQSNKQAQYFNYKAPNHNSSKQSKTQHSQPNKQNPTYKINQQRPKSAQPYRQDQSIDKLSELYYHGMEVKLDKQEQYKRIKLENEQRIMQKCTFRPEITQKAQILSLENNNYLPIDMKTYIHMKRQQLKIEIRKDEKMKEEVKGCTFTPKLNPKKYKPLLTDEQNMSVYDRQVEWQKKVQNKNNERMINSYTNIMTPSKSLNSRSGSAQKKSSLNQENNNPHYSITNTTKRLKQTQGFFSEKRGSGTFLTYLNYKYDFNNQNQQDSSKCQDDQQTLITKKQDIAPLDIQQNLKIENQDIKNVRIQKALDLVQNISNIILQKDDQQDNEKSQNKDFTFGVKYPTQPNTQSSQTGQVIVNEKNEKENKSQQKKQQHNVVVVSKKEQTKQNKNKEQTKQPANKSIQQYFSLNKNEKNQSQKLTPNQYSYVNTMPKKVNFNSTSKLQNIVVSKNQYTLQDTENQEEVQEFQSLKEYQSQSLYKQYQEKNQPQLKTLTEQIYKNINYIQTSFNQNRDNQASSIQKQQFRNSLYQQAYKINKEIKEIHGSAKSNKNAYIDQYGLQ